MKKIRFRWLAILAVLMLVNLVCGGTWTPNQFIYKPSLGARGEEEYNKFNLGVDRLDAHLGKHKNLGDPGYSTLAEALTTIGSNQVTLTIPAGTVAVNANTSIPTNIHLRVLQGGMFSVADAITLTINGSPEAGPYQIFSWSGSGNIKISPTTAEVLVDWFIPANATDHTTYIKKAVTSTLPTSGNTRSAVIFTKASYNIANLSFDYATEGIDHSYMSLIGRPATARGMVTLIVAPGSNGIFISGNSNNTYYCNDWRMENFFIRKASYAGDSSGDYGLRMRVTQFVQLRNVRFENFGGAGLRIQNNYYSTFEDLDFWHCYRAIQWDEDPYSGYPQVGGQFVNSKFVGCKTYIHATVPGIINAHFRGATSDDHVYNANPYIDIQSRGKTLTFQYFWFEGIAVGGTVLNLRPQTGVADTPNSSQLMFRDCIIAARDKSSFVATSDDATATITLDKTEVYWAVHGNSTYYERLVMVPNYTDSQSQVAMLELTDTPNSDSPKIRLSTPSSTWGPGIYPSGISLFNGDTVSSWGGQVSHRIHDETHLPSTWRTDGFRSSVRGLWAPMLRLQQGASGYGTEIAISCGAAVPTATTGDAATSTPYKLTNIGSVSQFSAGDPIRVTGAGSGGSNLDTHIVALKSDGSEIIIKDPVLTTVAGTALSINATVGMRKINTTPAEQGSSGSKYVVQGWVCIAAGQPGSWVQMRMLTGN